MGASYASPAEVAAALDLPELARLSADVQAGQTQIALDRPADVAPGAQVLVGHGAAQPDIVTAAGGADTTLNLAQPLTNGWPAGTRLLDVTPFGPVAEAASRLVDALTWSPAEGFAYAEAEEVHHAVADRDGNLTVTVNRFPVREVLEFRYQERPWLPEWSAPVNEVWFEDDTYIVRAFVADFVPATPGRRVRVKVHYVGGYQDGEMPAGIRRATAILAARLWKEKDSGYSDVIGSPDFGLLQYREAAPKDVVAMLSPWRRVGWT